MYAVTEQKPFGYMTISTGLHVLFALVVLTLEITQPEKMDLTEIEILTPTNPPPVVKVEPVKTLETPAPQKAKEVAPVMAAGRASKAAAPIAKVSAGESLINEAPESLAESNELNPSLLDSMSASENIDMSDEELESVTTTNDNSDILATTALDDLDKKTKKIQAEKDAKSAAMIAAQENENRRLSQESAQKIAQEKKLAAQKIAQEKFAEQQRIAKLEKEEADRLAAARKASLEAQEKAQKEAAAKIAASAASNSNKAGNSVRALEELRQMPGNNRPQYDSLDRLNKRQGEVAFIAYVSKSGTLYGFKLIKSSGHRELDVKTLKAIKSWKFYPGQEGWVEIPFRWDLVGGAKEMPTTLRRSSL